MKHSPARSQHSIATAAHSQNESTRVIGRRSFLAAAGAAASVAATAWGRDYGSDAAPVRYPDPDIIALDKRFDKIKIGNTPIQRLHTGMLWAEGPAWNGVGRYLVWSDIPNDVQMRWLEEDGHVSKFRQPAGNSNGNTFDERGRQISCEHGNRRVVRYEPSGTVTVLADKFQGKPLNAPNDVIVRPDDGSIWFTDPGYGSLLNYEGNKGDLQLKEAVYRIDAKSGKLEKLTDEIYKPNGLCFSPDYKKLYVADTGASHYPDAPHNIKVWDVVDGVKLAHAREFASMKLDGFDRPGMADGIRADIDGNIWSSAGWVGDGYDGVHIFAPDGERIGQIRLPEICSNVCFGGRKRNRLFMTGSQSLYAVYVETQGAGIA
ncbi:MAG TPA: SMP-30/gluconolactonase/LRE family protein [Pirellulales bacterium]|nr:SMP-30/gluconolactonase/LRE family protein [Pirellulales bacterium]